MFKWLIALLIAVFIFLPKIASTPLGKPIFVKALETRCQCKLEVGSLSLSWFGPQKFKQIAWSRGNAAGAVEEFQIAAPFWSFSGAFHLKNGSILYKGGKVDQIQGQIEGNDFELTGVTLQGHISLKGQIYSRLHFNIQIDITNFPLIVIDQRLDQILGPTLNLKGNAALHDQEGLLNLDITTANLTTNIRGFLTEHSITLRDPLIASIRLTPELSALLLKDANPLFLTGLESPQPIPLRIEPKDFLFPLPFSLSKLQIGHAVLDLGKVKCKNGKSLAAIISLLKAESLANAREMNAWFTPLTFRLHSAILETDRMDLLLADSIHLCTWGKINLLQDKLNMNLGIPADTLKKFFGIKNLPENYVLKIPITGSTQSPDIATTAAAAKITALALPKKGFLKNLFQPKEDKEVPPIMHPLPWIK